MGERIDLAELDELYSKSDDRKRLTGKEITCMQTHEALKANAFMWREEPSKLCGASRK